MRLLRYIQEPIHIAPLATFRVVFGAMMFFGTIRFMARGWVSELYVEPSFFFPFWGFEWVQPLGAGGMQALYGAMAVSALCIALGLLYRLMAPLFFLAFTYAELIDKTNYLNHYYFVSIAAFLLLLVPAHRHFSLDAHIFPKIRASHAARWTVGIFRLQIGMVYFFAGVAKLNADWLLRAMPLRIWLPAKSNLWLIGPLLQAKWVAFAFAWLGAAYDLFIAFFLAWRKSRWLAFAAVIAFHVMTAILFPFIGLFPYIMILNALVFFDGESHRRAQDWISKRIFRSRKISAEPKTWTLGKWKGKMVLGLLALHFVLQTALPFRYLLYPGNLFWTEEGYRFSWRVMLIEKAGTAFFYVGEKGTGKELEVDNAEFLSPNQEKMMATQPDMILQYARHLREVYAGRGVKEPIVRAEIYVTLNGSGSRPFVDSELNLAQEKEGWAHKAWILPFEE